MKKDLQIAVFLVFFLIILSALSPTTIYATNGHQLSAIGAYQEGMGGATTAAPYDASTSITNPAGMALIGNRTDFSFMTFFPSRSLQYAGGEETFGGSPMYLVPAVGWTAPVNDRNDLFFGGGMYGVSGMGVDFGTIRAPLMEAPPPFGPGFGAGTAQAHIWSQYQFWKMAPTLAYKTGNLAVGFALNLDYQAFGFKQVFTGAAGPLGPKVGFDLSELEGALGYGATVGAIYQIRPELTVGASYSTKQKFGDFKWRLAANDIITMTGQTSQDGMYKMKLDFPQQVAVGIAVRPVKKLLWTADVKWINYHDTYNIVKLRGTFGGAGGDSTDLTFGWDNVWVYATGLQYDVTPKLAVRVGYNHSTSPLKNDDVDNNVALPAIVKDRVAGGFTYRLGRHWEYTLAFMKAFKQELTAPMSGTKISLEEQAVDFELSYRF
jgi:long-chain fatty acid transport protein